MKEQENFEQSLTRKRNTVLELELNARYWKAQYELKHYTIEENKLKDAYNDILQAKQSMLDNIDKEINELKNEASQPEDMPESNEQKN